MAPVRRPKLFTTAAGTTVERAPSQIRLRYLRARTDPAGEDRGLGAIARMRDDVFTPPSTQTVASLCNIVQPPANRPPSAKIVLTKARGLSPPHIWLPSSPTRAVDSLCVTLSRAMRSHCVGLALCRVGCQQSPCRLATLCVGHSPTDRRKTIYSLPLSTLCVSTSTRSVSHFPVHVWWSRVRDSE